MKNLTIFFGMGVGGIVICLIMTIYTGVQEARQKAAPPTHVIPPPAMGQ